MLINICYRRLSPLGSYCHSCIFLYNYFTITISSIEIWYLDKSDSTNLARAKSYHFQTKAIFEKWFSFVCENNCVKTFAFVRFVDCKRSEFVHHIARLAINHVQPVYQDITMERWSTSTTSGWDIEAERGVRFAREERINHGIELLSSNHSTI